MDEIEYVLTRGVEQVLPDKDALTKLMQERKIKLYQGFDPSSNKLHIGNLIGIRKLAQFQKLGHKIIFLIGDFTGMIGDPTDKAAARQKLTREEVLKNAEGYKKQVEKFIDFNGENAAEIKYNSEWSDKLNGVDMINLASNFTVQQMLERDFYQERLKNEKPIYLHEFLYPMMQGYDSMVMDVDLEIGGNDQLFNMMAGRNLMKQKEKFVLTMKLMTDPSGAKMGKTTGNTINLTDSGDEIYGKVMNLSDSLIDLGVELLTDLPLNYADNKEPMEAKKGLAREIVKLIHNDEEGKKAEEYFEQAFQRGQMPEEVLEVKVTDGMTVLDLVFESKVVDSRSEAKRLIKDKAIKAGEKILNNPGEEIDIPDGGIIVKIGKKNFVKFIK